MEYQKTMGYRIKALRKVSGKTQQNLADELGVDIKTERKWEKNQSKPDYDTIDRLCKILECDPDFLFLRIDERTHAITDFKKETGLSEGAFKELSFYPEELEGIILSEDIINRERSLGIEQHSPVISWFIEHGLLDCIKGLDSIKRFNNEETYTISILPDNIKKMLEFHYKHALNQVALTDRKREFMDKIAMDLFFWGIQDLKKYVKEFNTQDRAIVDGHMFLVEVDGEIHGCMTEAKGIRYFYEVDFFLQHEEDFKKEEGFENSMLKLIYDSSQFKRDLIVLVASDMCNKSFDYFENKYIRKFGELENRKASFNDLLNEFMRNYDMGHDSPEEEKNGDPAHTVRNNTRKKE